MDAQSPSPAEPSSLSTESDFHNVESPGPGKTLHEPRGWTFCLLTKVVSNPLYAHYEL